MSDISVNKIALKVDLNRTGNGFAPGEGIDRLHLVNRYRQMDQYNYRTNIINIQVKVNIFL